MSGGLVVLVHAVSICGYSETLLGAGQLSCNVLGAAAVVLGGSSNLEGAVVRGVAKSAE